MPNLLTVLSDQPIVLIETRYFCHRVTESKKSQNNQILCECIGYIFVTLEMIWHSVTVLLPRKKIRERYYLTITVCK